MNTEYNGNKSWKEILKGAGFIKQFLIPVIILLLLVYFYSRFLIFIEAREGFRFTDPLLSFFSPFDLTWIIFILLYSSLVWGIFFLIKTPAKLIEALRVYTIMIAFRILAMYLLPLEPPVTMIPLQDPFIEFFGTGQLLTKDLFFSGHTATMFILFLTAKAKRERILFLIVTIVIAALVVIQHVHYTIDVIAAFFFTYCSYSIVKKLEFYSRKV
ncbi:MAG TPA: phosphatase PAP2-related protein [Ignavibacteriaceae bacterium]|nr:phosphatase PAP2-related protein [Ignavibacteriaceae bacterium]